MIRYTFLGLGRAAIAALLAMTVSGGAQAQARQAHAPAPSAIPAGPFERHITPEEDAAIQARVKAHTAQANALDAKARGLLAKRHYAQAAAAAREAVNGPACETRTWILLIDVYKQWGKPAEALATYREMMSPAGHSAGSDFSTEMGFVLMLAQAGQWGEAAAAYDRYMQLTHAHWGLALEDGMPPAARFTDRAGLLAAANFGVGAFGPCWEASPYEYMAEHLREAIRLRTDWAYAHFELAQALSHLKGHQAEELSEYDAVEALADAAGDADLKTAAQLESRGLRLMAWAAAHRAKQAKAQAAEKEKGGGSAAPSK